MLKFLISLKVLTVDKPDNRTFFGKYRNAVLFNKNLLISGAAGFFGSAFVSQVYSQYDNNDFVASVLALSTEYGVYIPLFSFLFYIDNRQRYIDGATGKRITRKPKEELKKLFAAFTVSEAIYAITKLLTQYQFLQIDSIKPYEASMMSSLIAWALFFVSINTMAKIVKLFSKP